MKLSFFGADQCVTGSCHCLDIGGKRILVDCGLQQGRDEVSNAEFPFAANTINYLLVTHAHIDHSGRIPMLIKQGFQGKILTTRLTAELLDIMLLDSAHIQEQDAEWKNRKGERSGAPHVDPLYTIEDAQRVREFMTTCEYGQVIDLCEGVEVEFVDAGHLLGSACIAMDLTENGVKKRIVFSGDLGKIKQPIIRDPVHFHGADYVVMESTYGDRNHTEVWSYTDDLARIIDETMARGGNVIIPSFAVGRTQELLYFIREIKDARMVKSNPDFPVYIDSPLAKRATTIFTGNLHGYLDEDAMKLVKDGTHMFNFTNLRMTETSEESKALNEDRTPKVIISASGMCDAGRIRHHLKHNLWRGECTILFVGFQSPGTLGRALIEGADEVRLFGETVQVNAQIRQMSGLSGHADRDGLLTWIRHFDPKPKHVFVNHGEDLVADHFARTLTAEGIPAEAPYNGAVYELTGGAVALLRQGTMVPMAKASQPADKPRTSPAFERLLNMGKRLLVVIEHNRGGANKDLARFASQIASLCDKWDR